MTEDDGFANLGLTRKQLLVRGGGLAISASALLSACGSSSSGGSSSGGSSTAVKGIGAGVAITKLSELAPYRFDDTVGPKPNLPKRLSFANVNTADIYILFAQGMEKACSDRGVDFVQANAQTKAADNVRQIQSFLQRGTGVLQLIPLGPKVQDAVSRQALKSGVAVFNLTTAPSTCQQVADQYKVGQAHGEAAAAWIRENLGGKATVAYFNLNAISPVLVQRSNAALQALKALPGVKVIDVGVGQTDFSPQGGFKLTSSLLQAHKDVDVIMGADTFIEGAVKAVTSTGNSTVKYVSGVDGEAPVLSQIKAGGLIKATFGFAWPMLGYATGQFAADWLEGKAIPQAIVVDPIQLDSAAAISAFETKNADPAKYWKTTPDYLTFLGSISYGTREKWLQNALVGGPA